MRRRRVAPAGGAGGWDARCTRGGPHMTDLMRTPYHFMLSYTRISLSNGFLAVKSVAFTTALTSRNRVDTEKLSWHRGSRGAELTPRQPGGRGAELTPRGPGRPN